MVRLGFIRSVLVVATMVALAGPLEAESLIGTYDDGDLEVRLKVSHPGIRTADRVAVILEARAPEGSVIVMPEFSGRLGEFRVRDAWPGQPRISPETGLLERVDSWILEPYLPGIYTIPAFVVTSRPGEGASVGRFKVGTPEVSVEVLSMFPSEEQKSPSLRAAAEPMREHTRWLPILIFLLVVPPGVAMILRFLRQEREGNPLEGDADEAADVAALAALDGLGESGNAGGLQEVLNGYLRGRFHQRTRGRSLEEVSKKLRLEEEAKAIFGGLVDQLQRARYGRSDEAQGATTMAGELLREFVRKTGVKGEESAS